jgi:hypothetical protein
MHHALVPATQEIPKTVDAPVAPLGKTIGAFFQLVPLPDAEYTIVSVPVAEEPSAVHDDTESQETASSRASGGVVAPFGSGAVAVVHDFPFQAATVGYSELMVPSLPTAAQWIMDEQETPLRTPSVAPLVGSETACLAQNFPFQRAASGVTAVTVAETALSPTISHERADGHDTPLRKPALTRGRRGRTLHLAPFHCSANGVAFGNEVPGGSVSVWPTARQ